VIIILIVLVLLRIFADCFEYKCPDKYAHYEGLINLEHPDNYDNMIEGYQNDRVYLFSYWELIGGAQSPPHYIDLCFDTMRKNGAKHFNFVLLNEKNIFEYLPDLRQDINDLPIALKTDYIRIALLYRYGGIWMDADTIMVTDLADIAEMLKESRTDYVGFGCTGYVCRGQTGYNVPSNGVMGSVRHGRLIGRCLDNLNKKLDLYYKTPKDKRKELDYFELGKTIIWQELRNLKAEDPNYKYNHQDAEVDGTRDRNGHWIAKKIIFKDPIDMDIDRLKIVMLVNSSFCGGDPVYNWFCRLSKNDILNGDYYISRLFRKALNVEKH
jgi:hypothetical protein